MAWWYNTESGALTSAGGIQSFFQQIQGDVGLGAGWHHLKISDNATGAQAAAEAKKEFPNGAPPTTDVGKQVVQETSQIATGDPTAITGAVDGLSAIGAALHTFVSAVTDGKMWRSLAWVILGLLLVLGGTALWLRGTVNPLAALRRQ